MLRAIAFVFCFVPCLTLAQDADKTSTPTASRPSTALKFTKWSGAINVPDPVAISFDNRGRAYVTQTQRRKSQDLDIRQNREWVPSDVGFQSVQDKIDFYRRELAPGDDKENAKHVQDMNKDGHHDYRDLMVLSEKIHLLSDTDGNGTADVIQEFAAGFQTEVTGIAAGVLHHDGKVYSTIAPEVWQLEDTDNDGAADRRHIMATGFGLHIAYAGHDMHGLTVGPDGKIYWSVGDKGISATSKAGEKFHYPNQGGVMRCNPDGSDFEVFAHGLRNVQELAFDQYGNLFGVDNDADKPNERERFVYIVKDMDAGWRCNYQYRGKDYDPWVAEKLWQPWHEGQAAYIIPPISHSIDGPAGFAFNPGTALSPAYKNYFFLTGAPNGNQIAFQVKPSGASFQMANEHKIGSGVPLVGINFAPDGGLYGVDWGGGYPLNQSGAVWKIDDPKFAGSEKRKAVQQILNTGVGDFSTNRVVELLGHEDQRVRLLAQFELVARSDFDSLKKAVVGKIELARFHAVWGLGQLARSGNEAAQQEFVELLEAPSLQPELLAQVLFTIGDLKDFDSKLLLAFLTSQQPRVQFAAAMTLADHPTEGVVDKLVAFAEELQPADTYLRFALARALSTCALPQQQAFQNHRNKLLRLASVVALRRSTADGREDGINGYLHDRDLDVATEAARAIHDDFSTVDSLGPLASMLGQASQTTPTSEAFVRRSINANFRIGTEECASTVANYASDDRQPLGLRVAALETLRDWEAPSPLDRVTGRYREYSSERTINKVELARMVSKWCLEGDPAIRAMALSVATSLQVKVDEKSLRQLARSEELDVQVRIAALDALKTQGSGELKNLLLSCVESSESPLRIRSVELLAELDRETATKVLTNMLQTSTLLPERQRAIELLGTVETTEADAQLLKLMRSIAAKPESRSVRLELLSAAKTRAAANNQIRLALDKFHLSRTTVTNPVVLYDDCLDGGSAHRGKQVFNTHLGAQCVRCHRIGRNGSDVGPRLDGIAKKRDALHLLRAVVSPSSDIDANYRTQTVLLDSGESLQGVVSKQDEHSLVLLDAQGKEQTIPLEEIEERIEQDVSLMPEVAKVLKRREIRDLVAYLKTLK